MAGNVPLLGFVLVLVFDSQLLALQILMILSIFLVLNCYEVLLMCLVLLLAFLASSWALRSLSFSISAAAP